MSSINLGTIGQIALHVGDIERSVGFYGGKLGMTMSIYAYELKEDFEQVRVAMAKFA